MARAGRKRKKEKREEERMKLSSKKSRQSRNHDGYLFCFLVSQKVKVFFMNSLIQKSNMYIF